ncbi:MAG TPA: PIN domain-containing protein [Thermoanaerobaculia bacterium]|nr:PIN domain-containing protein [Thermoanaerobaculia bacterium]
MKGYLLDTNVLSELVRKRPSAAVLERIQGFPRKQLSTSSICVTELRYGAARHPQGGPLWARITSEVLGGLRILPVAQAEAERAGDLLAELDLRGTPIGIEDVLIGATALVHGLVVATRNVRHFDRIEGLTVESWWET